MTKHLRGAPAVDPLTHPEAANEGEGNALTGAIE